MKKALIYYFVFMLLQLLIMQGVYAKITDRIDLVFSHKSGFYNSNFTLKISTTKEGMQLLYTIDGSEPSTSSSAKSENDTVSILVNPNLNIGRGKTPAFIVRAVLKNGDSLYSKSETRTFLFLDKVKNQHYPGGAWPGKDINNQMLDYSMASDIATTAPYSFQLIDALKQIPTISVVSDLKNLFDSKSGIYVNSQYKGIEWERPCSVELINPNGQTGFQINAGLRIRGGNSAKNKNNPKHGFRLFFREVYGAGKLKFPLFDDEGSDEYDCIDLRCEQNYSWSMDGSDHNTMVKDIFCRDLQREMGQPYKRGRQYHLYLNGMYWGIYQSDERAEASFAASYLGGEKEDYDIVKVNTQPWPYYNEATDGNLDAWDKLWKLCQKGFQKNENYFSLEGKNAKGVFNNSGEVLVDIDNLIDYMLVIFYSGNFDAPVSGWHNNDMPNNFYAIYNRKNKSQGFKFLVHDSEHSMFVESVYGFKGLYENRVNLGSTGKMKITNMQSFNPQWLHYKLTSNAEYRQRFANRAYLYLENGILSPEKAKTLFQTKVEEIETAIIAESARWGDAQANKSLTKTDDWLPEINKMYNDFFPARTAIVIKQLNEAGLWPKGEAPQIIMENEDVANQKIDFSENLDVILINTNNEGTLYYTLNGETPREIGGSINTGAIATTNEESLVFTTTTILTSQVKFNEGWGPVSSSIFRNRVHNFENLKVTELHYHPEDVIDGDDTISGKDFEFIEFKNIGSSIIDLSGLSIDSGINYQFPYNSVLESEAYYVVASKPNKFYSKYGSYPNGNFKKNLSNSGELIQMSDETDKIVLAFTYSDKTPWPENADGKGFSLTSVETNPEGAPSDYSYWKVSNTPGGSPGRLEFKTKIVELNSKTYSPKIYPNPAIGNIDFFIPDFYDNVNIKGFDLSGRIVFESEIKNGQSIDLSGYSIKPGVYIIMMKVEEVVYFQKLTVI